MRLFNLIFLCLGLVNLASAQIEIKGYTKYIENPSESIISDDGQTMYVANGKGLRVYEIDATTHLLKKIQDLEEGGSGGGVISPDNKFIITTNYGDDAIFVYERNPTDGKLSLYKSYENKIGQAILEEPSSLSMSNNGRFVCLKSGKKLLSLKFAAGELTYHNESDIGYFAKVHFSPDSKHAFVEEYGKIDDCPRTVLSFDEQMGTFEVVACLQWQIPVAGSYYDVDNNKRSCYVIPELQEVAFSPDGKDVYMLGSHMKERGSAGAFAHYRWVNGELKVQKAYSHLAETYQIGTLKNIYVDGSGDYLYILTGGDDSGIHVFKRDQGTGALTKVKSFRKRDGLSRIVTAYRMSFSQDNQYAYVSNYFGGNVVVLKNSGAKPSPKKSRPNKNNQPKPIVNTNPNHNSNNSSNNNNNSTNACQYTSITTEEITRVEERLNNLDTEQARYDYALKALQNRCMETVQVLRLARVFEVEYMRLEFVKFAYYYTSDVENFYLLDTLFTNDRLKDAFKKTVEG